MILPYEPLKLPNTESVVKKDEKVKINDLKYD